MLQNDALPHYHIDMRAIPVNVALGHWIGQRGPIEYPTRSPDLIPSDLFMGFPQECGVKQKTTDTRGTTL
ncbi:hypothetical protein TNCV_3004951 [Trichonephila clavipes]|nr:hypothetical protein TNCV_3004951 [Trichonephila clavipes]